MDIIAPALIAFNAAVLVGFLGHFGVEDYRRFRDSQAIAAALAGELSSIITSLSELRDNLTKLKALADQEIPISMPEMPDQSSPLFEANADKIGLLGVDLAEGVAFIYDQIRAFRTSFQLLSKYHKINTCFWSSMLIGRCAQLIDDNKPKGISLVGSLKKHSKLDYAMLQPVRVAVLAVVTLLSLSGLFGAVFCLWH